jgi:hypothetical protein
MLQGYGDTVLRAEALEEQLVKVRKHSAMLQSKLDCAFTQYHNEVQDMQVSVFKPLDLHGSTRSKVEGGDRHDLEPEGTREDTRHKIYTGLGSQSSYPTSCLE